MLSNNKFDLENGSINYSIFKNLNLKNINEIDVKETIEIGKSIGISIRNDNMMDSIEFKYQLYNNINKMVSLRDRLNNETFKNLKLTLDESVVSAVDVPFFKCFRNKVIFYNIFSNFNSIYSYDRLTNPQYIIENFTNGIEIVMDKVKSGCFMVLDCKELQSLFEIFYKNNNGEHIKFYQNLFINYSKLFYQPHMFSMITHSNKISFLQYINHFQINKSKIERIFKGEMYSRPFEFILDNYQNYKLYGFIKNNYTLPNTIILNVTDFDIFNNESFKFKHLIKVCKLIEAHKLYININNSGYYINSILDKNQIDSISMLFSSQQLNLPILKLLYSLNGNIGFGSYYENGNKVYLNHHVFKLIKMFYSITLLIKPIYYYFMFYDSNAYKNIFQYGPEYLTDTKMYNLLKCNSRNDQYQYISYIFNSKNCKFDIIDGDTVFLVKSILKIDDLHLLEFIHLKFKSCFSQILKTNLGSILSSIKSINILNWFYENYQDLVFCNGNEYWIQLQNKTLLKEYENKIIQLKRTLSIGNYKLKKKFIKSEMEQLIRAFKHIHKFGINDSIYQFSTDVTIFNYIDCFDMLYKHKQDLFIKFFKYFPSYNCHDIMMSHMRLQHKAMGIDYFRFCVWLNSICIETKFVLSEKIQIKIQPLKDKVFSISINSSSYIKMLYCSGSFKELVSFISESPGKQMLFFSFISYHPFVELKKQFINYCSNEISNNSILSKFFKSLLIECLDASISEHNYPFIKFLYINYPIAFKKKNLVDESLRSDMLPSDYFEILEKKIKL